MLHHVTAPQEARLRCDFGVFRTVNKTRFHRCCTRFYFRHCLSVCVWFFLVHIYKKTAIYTIGQCVCTIVFARWLNVGIHSESEQSEKSWRSTVVWPRGKYDESFWKSRIKLTTIRQSCTLTVYTIPLYIMGLWRMARHCALLHFPTYFFKWTSTRQRGVTNIQTHKQKNNSNLFLQRGEREREPFVTKETGPAAGRGKFTRQQTLLIWMFCARPFVLHMFRVFVHLHRYIRQKYLFTRINTNGPAHLPRVFFYQNRRIKEKNKTKIMFA